MTPGHLLVAQLVLDAFVGIKKTLALQREATSVAYSGTLSKPIYVSASISPDKEQKHKYLKD